RLEDLAEPGSVFISEIVFSQVRGRVPLEFDDLGPKSLKNIPESVRVYRVSRSAAAGPDAETLQSKPSVLVLPFANMSGDPEQEFFSDGITEDITPDLSQVSALFVAARHTAFTFKGKAVETAQVARRLNVRYLIEGSVRRAGKRMRITAQ